MVHREALLLRRKNLDAYYWRSAASFAGAMSLVLYRRNEYHRRFYSKAARLPRQLCSKLEYWSDSRNLFMKRIPRLWRQQTCRGNWKLESMQLLCPSVSFSIIGPLQKKSRRLLGMGSALRLTRKIRRYTEPMGIMISGRLAASAKCPR